MVEVAFHQRFRPVRMGFLPGRILAHLMVGIPVAVRLLVGLVHDIEAPAVTKLVKVFPVGVVAGAQEIDVGLLHQADVLLVGCVIDIAAGPGMMVMPVHAAQLHVLSVDLEHRSGDLHLLDTQVIVEMFHHPALSVPQFHAEGIQVGLFRRPELRILQLTVQLNQRRVTGGQPFHGAGRLLPVQQKDGPQVLRRLPAGIAEEHAGFDGRPAVTGVRLGCHPVIGDVHQGAHPELHGAENAGKPPHVLVFQIAAVTPSVHFHGQLVPARTQIPGYVEFGRRHGVLAVADFLTIHPDIHGGMHPAEMKDEVLAEHLLRNVHKGHIRTDGIAVLVSGPVPGRFGSHARAVPLEGIADVDIDGRAVALRLPVAGNGNRSPAADIIVLPVEVGRTLLRIPAPVEKPLSVQAHDFHALLFPRRQLKCRVIRQLVDSQHGRILPVRNLRPGRQGRNYGQT